MGLVSITLKQTDTLAKRNFNTEFKMGVLTLLKAGVSKKAVCRMMGIDRREVVMWERRYHHHGADGLERLRRRLFTDDFKRQLAQDFLSGKSTMRQLALEHDVSLSSVKNWVRQYRQSQATESNN